MILEVSVIHPEHTQAMPHCRGRTRLTLVPMPVGGRRNNPESFGDSIGAAVRQAWAYLVGAGQASEPTDPNPRAREPLRGWTEERRKAQSEAMRAYWAQRKADGGRLG